jgi:N-acetylglucosaminyldiphosphoundecaprenol N-acetyl-beta-D-mannosaminyltransferase
MAIERITHWVTHRIPAAVGFTAVHGLVLGARDPQFRKVCNGLDLLCPDGQPLRWALRLFHRERLSERVYGPHTMWKLCAWAEQHGQGVYLYGSSPAVIERLSVKLRESFPKINLCGAESPPFRPLSDEESAAMVQRINNSGASLVFIGLGCPKQEQFIYAYRGKLRGVLLAVGAAFDFHAGTLKMAPPWMQKAGLEWLFRFMQEPRRLWKRYVGTNSYFLLLCLKRVLIGPRPRGPVCRIADQ